MSEKEKKRESKATKETRDREDGEGKGGKASFPSAFILLEHVTAAAKDICTYDTILRRRKRRQKQSSRNKAEPGGISKKVG